MIQQKMLARGKKIIEMKQNSEGIFAEAVEVKQNIINNQKAQEATKNFCQNKPNLEQLIREVNQHTPITNSIFEEDTKIPNYSNIYTGGLNYKK